MYEYLYLAEIAQIPHNKILIYLDGDLRSEWSKKMTSVLLGLDSNPDMSNILRLWHHGNFL